MANFNKLAEEKNSVFRLKYIDCTLFLCTKDQLDNDDYIERLQSYSNIGVKAAIKTLVQLLNKDLLNNI